MKTLDALQRVAAPLGDAVVLDARGQVSLRKPDALPGAVEAVVRTAVLGEEPDRRTYGNTALVFYRLPGA